MYMCVRVYIVGVYACMYVCMYVCMYWVNPEVPTYGGGGGICMYVSG